MTNPNRIRGNRGEKLACDYLTRNGYRIVDTNFHSRFGEIDIIAIDGCTMVFLEVKCFSARNYIPPHFAVSQAKRQKIIKTAKTYLIKNSIPDQMCRFDAILIIGTTIEHITGAFTI